MSAAGEFTELARRGGRGALVTRARGPGAGGKMLVRADGDAQRLARRRRRSTTQAARHADELMWAERSERRDEGETSCSSTSRSRRRG